MTWGWLIGMRAPKPRHTPSICLGTPPPPAIYIPPHAPRISNIILTPLPPSSFLYLYFGQCSRGSCLSRCVNKVIKRLTLNLVAYRIRYILFTAFQFNFDVFILVFYYFYFILTAISSLIALSRGTRKSCSCEHFLVFS